MDATAPPAPSAKRSGSPVLTALASYVMVSTSLVVCLFLTDHHNFRENELAYIWRLVFLMVGSAGSLVVCVIVFIGVWLMGRHRQPSWRQTSRWVLCLSVSAVALGAAIVAHFRSPASPMAYFAATFGANLPSAATDVRVRGGTPADSDVRYSFSCSEVDTLALVKALRMKETLPTEGYSRDDFEAMWSPPGWPDYTTWKDRRRFTRRNGKTGRIDTLICNAIGTQVYLCKDPLADKTDEELGVPAKEGDGWD